MNKAMVESTTLMSVAYDEACELLQLEFRSGSVYHYFGVPSVAHEGLLNARSKGSYFNSAIRGRFPYALRAAVEQDSEVGRG